MSQPILPGRWPTRLVVLLLLLLCGWYGSYRAVHLAIGNDEVGLLDSARQNSYAKLFFASDKDSNLHFLATLLAKPCIELLPLNEITAARLPSLLGLALFLWGIWRIGLEFPTRTTRVLITLALLSNAFLLDFFSLARGYGIGLGATMLALSCLLRSEIHTDTRQAAFAIWLAAITTLAHAGFLYFFIAILAVTALLMRRERIWVHGLLAVVMLAAFFFCRLSQEGPKNLLMYHVHSYVDDPDVGNSFFRDTVGTILQATFYDWPVSSAVAYALSAFVLLAGVITVWESFYESVRPARAISLVSLSLVAVCVLSHLGARAKYPTSRLAVYFIPVAALMFGTMAAWSRQRWLRLLLWGLLLALTGIGLQGANLSHAVNSREGADIPSVLLTLQEVHQQTGQDVVVAISGSKWPISYYAEHLLGLHPDFRQRDLSYLRTYDWLTVYEWKILQTFCGLPPDNPLLPGTTHILLNLANRDDQHLLATPLPGGLAQLHFYPASDTRLVMLIAPQHQGVMTLPSGQRYVGEFKRGWMNGRGTYTWPDGRKYEGEFKDDEPNGRGTYTWPDGRNYVGEFREGQVDGVGKLTYPDGRVEDGLWKQGQLVRSAQH